MLYERAEELDLEPWSPAYFAEVDRRFFAAAQESMPGGERPFDAVIDYEGLAEKDVLEVGVGLGAHAQLLAASARSFTGIDLTDHAIGATSARLKHAGLEAKLERMDAEEMSFADASFDYVWSWGVIHHSANTERIVSEIARVLRPGGEAAVMVYHRSFWVYYVLAGLFHGVFRGELLRSRSLPRTLQSFADGAIARYYTEEEWRDLVGSRLQVEEVKIYGPKTDLLPLPAGALKNRLRHLIPGAWSRFVTNDLRQGQFLFARMRRPA